MKTLTYAVLGVLLLAPITSRAEVAPRPMASDSRIRQIPYDPNNVVEVVGTYGVATSIEFAPDENIKVVTMGDTIAWQQVPYQNRMFVKPVEPKAATNMTVMTDKRTYYFQLRSSGVAANAIYVVRFVYPTVASGMASLAAKSKAISADIQRVNSRYKIDGSRKARAAIKVTQVFDDGTFTYFEFKKGAPIPGIYVRTPDNKLTLANVRREGPYMVVEARAHDFELRMDDAKVMVTDSSSETSS
jgi:type IV secretion system protein VirB9